MEMLNRKKMFIITNIRIQNEKRSLDILIHKKNYYFKKIYFLSGTNLNKYQII